MGTPVRFPIRISPAFRVLLWTLLIPPGAAYVEVTDETVRVRLGWAFWSRIPRRLVGTAGPGKPPRLRFTAGAHGWAGRWLVNGSPDGIVAIRLAEPARAFVAGFPVRLKELRVSLDDPDGLLSAIGFPSP